MRLRLKEARPKDLNAAESLAVKLESYRLAEQQRGSTLRLTEIERKDGSDLALIKTIWSISNRILPVVLYQLLQKNYRIP